MDAHNCQAVSSAVNVFDWKRVRGKTHGNTLSIALVLNGLPRHRLCAIQMNRHIGCARQGAEPKRRSEHSYRLILYLHRSPLYVPVATTKYCALSGPGL
jgi:hypothetical protein